MAKAKKKAKKKEDKSVDWRGIFKLGLGTGRASLIRKAAEVVEHLAKENKPLCLPGPKELVQILVLIADLTEQYKAVQLYLTDLECDIDEMREEANEQVADTAYGDEDDFPTAAVLHNILATQHKAKAMQQIHDELTKRLEEAEQA